MKKALLVALYIAPVIAGEFVSTFKNPWKRRSMASHTSGKHRISKGSLLHYRKWEFSQYGEDGIIQEIFKRLEVEKGYAVEFGAWNGVYLSNTYNLFRKGWEGHLIEADEKRMNEVLEYFPVDSGVTFSSDFVLDDESDQEGRTFDEIADQYIEDREIDFLSIDIDGLDYYILKSLKRRPKVICIECCRGWHPLFDKEVDRKVATQNNHQPLLVYLKQARSMGYTPLVFNVNNLFLVRDEFAHLFDECPKDCLTLWRDSFRVAYLRKNVVNNRSFYAKYEDQDYQSIMPITMSF